MRLIVFVGLFISFSVFSQNKITVEKIWKEYSFFGKSVNGFSSMKDGDYFTQFSEINNKPVISKHKVVNYQDQGEIIVDLTTLKVGSETIKVDDYSFNADETKMLFSTQTKSIYRHSYTTYYYLYDLETKKLEALDNDHAPQTLAEYSPDGKKVAFIHDNDLFVKDLTSGKTTQLTTDGQRNMIINGTTDWVYEEEFAITKGYGWSPDSKSIAYMKFNECKVKEFTMTYYKDLYPDLYTFKYPKAGEDNSKVDLYITSVVKPKAVKVNIGEYEYIPRMQWSPIENTLIVQTLNRHQDNVKYNKVEWDGKSAKSTVFHEETAYAYVEIDDNLLILKDGKSIIRTSEKDGYNHIYKVDFEGNIEAITKGSWDVIEFYGIDEAEENIYFSAGKQGAIHKGIYKTNISSKETTPISSEFGQNNGQFTSGMNYFVRSSSTANTVPTYTLCNNAGEELITMEDNSALNERLSNYNLTKKEFVDFKLDGRTLNGWMMKPVDFDSTKQYPVYINIYGGPGHNTVADGWEGVGYMFHQLLAQEGYIVVSVDPRGTYYRGAEFKKSTYLQLGKLETEDFIDVAKLLGEYNYVDKSRIGIQGWSYGGFMTSLAMTKGNGVFKMGIAVAPVTNWRYYDNIYTERFMRTPAENASGYDDNSPINFVDNLQGNYLLIHGSGDDNVHYQNTMEMINALVAANKQFDMFIYPNKNHGIYGGNTRNHLYNMIVDYTKENL